MAKLIWATNETNSQNSDGCCALYFDEMPTEDEIKAVSTRDFRYESAKRFGSDVNFGGGASCPLGPFMYMKHEQLSALVVETPVSKAAGLVRIEMACG